MSLSREEMAEVFEAIGRRPTGTARVIQRAEELVEERERHMRAVADLQERLAADNEDDQGHTDPPELFGGLTPQDVDDFDPVWLARQYGRRR